MARPDSKVNRFHERISHGFTIANNANHPRQMVAYFIFYFCIYFVALVGAKIKPCLEISTLVVSCAVRQRQKKKENENGESFNNPKEKEKKKRK